MIHGLAAMRAFSFLALRDFSHATARSKVIAGMFRVSN